MGTNLSVPSSSVTGGSLPRLTLPSTVLIFSDFLPSKSVTDGVVAFTVNLKFTSSSAPAFLLNLSVKSLSGAVPKLALVSPFAASGSNHEILLALASSLPSIAETALSKSSLPPSKL